MRRKLLSQFSVREDGGCPAGDPRKYGESGLWRGWQALPCGGCFSPTRASVPAAGGRVGRTAQQTHSLPRRTQVRCPRGTGWSSAGAQRSELGLGAGLQEPFPPLMSTWMTPTPSRPKHSHKCVWGRRDSRAPAPVVQGSQKCRRPAVPGPGWQRSRRLRPGGREHRSKREGHRPHSS